MQPTAADGTEGTEGTEAAPQESPPLSESRGDRFKAAIAAARDRVETTRQSLESQRPDKAHIDIVFSTVERDIQRGGGLLAGALAYRFFFWMLPFVLVVIGGLGFVAAADQEEPQKLASSFGAFGFAAKSVSQAAADSEHIRVWALVIGIPALYFASVSFVKALMLAHALIWGVPNHKIRKKPLAALVMTGFLVGAMFALALENAIRRQSEGPGLVAVAFFLVIVGALWLFVSWHMPRPEGTKLLDLLPGTAVFVVGFQIVHFITIYYVSRKIASASQTYGALGSAAGILLSLFFVARVAVLGVEVNAETWARKQATAQPTPAPQPVETSSVDAQ